MKVPQPKGNKGSLKWVQILINRSPSILDQSIMEMHKLDSKKINWVSPLEKDNYAEYRDGDFLSILGLKHFDKKLKDFWPNGGPQWDALGFIKEHDFYFLVEAKANIPEIKTSIHAKSETSLSLIEKSLSETKNYLNCQSGLNWEFGFYQYANRIAHLYFLRRICKINAFLVFIYFLNDHTRLSTSREEWDGAITLQKQLMGLNRHKLQRYVADVFIDVNQLKGVNRLLSGRE